MAYRVLCILILALVSFSSIGQTFELSGGVVYSPKSDNSKTDVREITSSRPINDSVAIEQLTRTTYQIRNKVVPNIGCRIEGGMLLSISSAMSLRLGMNLNYRTFELITTQNFVNSELLSADTVPYTPINIGGTTCDSFVNSFLDINADDGNQMRILDLGVNVGAEYWILKNKMALGLGIGINTPIYTRDRMEFISRERMPAENTNQTICKYVLVEEIDESGNGFRNLKLDVNAYAIYSLSSQFGIKIAAYQSLSNVFVEKGQLLSQSHRYYKSLDFLAGITYRFTIKSDAESKLPL